MRLVANGKGLAGEAISIEIYDGIAMWMGQLALRPIQFCIDSGGRISIHWWRKSFYPHVE